jgi:hypothetical protein
MRIVTIAITGMLAASVAFPAAAAKKRPSQAASPPHATCTGLKPLCFSDCGIRGTDPTYCAYRCNFEWERCMKSGFWEGVLMNRPAERR